MEFSNKKADVSGSFRRHSLPRIFGDQYLGLFTELGNLCQDAK